MQHTNINREDNKDPARYFKVDPVLAKELRDYNKRIDEREMEWCWLLHEMTDEERMVRARIAEIAKTINCPTSYGFNEFMDDRERWAGLKHKEDLPPWFSYLVLNDFGDPDGLEAQVIARMAAFKQTPEGRARDRLFELEYSTWTKSAAEYSELEGLLALYPESGIHPNDPQSAFYQPSIRLANIRRRSQEDKIWLESRNLRRRRNSAQ